ncbi:MAG: site-specific DNA-methyltransferase [Clostridia bacterium]|nr:site-specific DNA-methyltransferase [Clostridia bacterium]
MQLKSLSVRHEVHDGKGPSCTFFTGDAIRTMDALMPELEGKVQLIYMDPPFMTGKRFLMRVRVGAAEWAADKSSLSLETYCDSKNRPAYLAMMRDVLTRCHKLLSDTGMLFLHVDYRAHPHLRLLADEIFGENNFLNEIVWAYNSGGRSVRSFSRKHDIILFYCKTDQYTFNLEDIKVPPTAPPSNHMRKHVDPDGRCYRSIRSNGKVYTYYDDEPVPPSDVWNDLSHLQQRDPERTGFETQKPLSLLTRIVMCASAKGDLVLDPFSGSGTTLDAATRNDRRAAGIGCGALCPGILRRRMAGRSLTIEVPYTEDNAACDAVIHPGVGFYSVELKDFCSKANELVENRPWQDLIDSWHLGYLDGDSVRIRTSFYRTRKSPELKEVLDLPVYEGTPVVCITDIAGGNHYSALRRPTDF